MQRPRLPGMAGSHRVGWRPMSLRRMTCVLLLASACGGSPPAPPSTTPAPAAQPSSVKQYDAATLFKNVGVVPAGFSHDGSKALVSMDSSGVYNLYAIPPAGGEPQRLTTSTESQFAASYFPADDRLLYSQDTGGNELDHLYVLDGQNVRDITPGDKTKATFLRFSRDGAWFWVTTNERDPKVFDLYRHSARDYQRELVFTN